MLLRVPHFFSQFKCLAGQCSDTCCVGWEIDIDDATLAKYRDMATLCECAGSARSNKKEFIRKLLKSIEGTHFKLEAGDRCPFLNQKGLCDVICNLGCNGTPQDENGESILCDICREHPRFVEVYGDIMEKGLGLCCEEAARLLLTSEPPPGGRESCLTLMESRVDDPPDELPDGVEEARDAIFQEREAIFGILADKSLPLNERLVEVLDFAQALSDSEDTSAPDKTFPDANSHYEGVPTHQAVLQTWIEILGEGESFGPAWDEAYRKMHQKGWGQSQALFTEEDGARIVSYLIFR